MWTTLSRLTFVTFLTVLSSSFFTTDLLAQEQLPCKVLMDQIDPFDSLRTIAAEPVPFGYMIPSRYETMDGPLMVEEAEAMFMYTEGDSISGFFFTLALPEYKLQSTKPGYNVMMLLADSTVIGFYTVPDEGEFTRDLNMRIYQHTSIVPLDYFYKLAFHEVLQIRVEYERQIRTLFLNEPQRLSLRRAIQCVGERTELYPIKP